MRKHSNRTKLLLTVFAAVGSVSAGCSDFANPDYDAVPDLLTIEELADEYEDRIGEVVIVEGQLSFSNDGQYYLRGITYAEPDADGFRLALVFGPSNVDAEQMRRCLKRSTLVTGTLNESNQIQVKYVKLTSDARIHMPENCFHYLD